MAIITISRGTFGGGKAVAEAVAEKLNYVCLSREKLVPVASKMFNIPEEDLTASILKSPAPLGINTGKIINHVKFMRAAFLEQAGANNLVYHGYGGHLLLQGLPNLLRVKIIAGMAYRIKHAMKDQGISREEAVAHIQDIDKKREHWTRSVWGLEESDNSCYDLIINLDQLSVPLAVSLISRILEEETFQETEADRQQFEDNLLVSRIFTELNKNKPTRQAQIYVTSKNGHVIITGDVGSHKIKDAISYITQNVKGVKEVSNDLNIGFGWRW